MNGSYAHLAITVKMFLLLQVSFFALYPIYIACSYAAVRLMGERVVRCIFWRGSRFARFTWHGTEWQIGCNPWGESGIWDSALPDIPARKRYAIYFGGPIGMACIFCLLLSCACFAGFSLKAFAASFGGMLLGSLLMMSGILALAAAMQHLILDIILSER